MKFVPRMFFDGPFSGRSIDTFSVFFWNILLVCLVTALFFAVVFIVFEGLGLSRMAKRKGIPNGWMGFVPVLNLYLLGKISNMPDRRRRSEIALLVLGVLSFLFSIICLAYFAPLIEMVIRAAGRGGGYYWGMNGGIGAAADAVGFLAMFSITLLIATGLSVALMVVMFIALHRVYKQFSPDNAAVMTVFTVLALVLGGIPIYPFMLFALRNNEIWPMGKPPQNYAGPSYPPNIPKHDPNASYAQAASVYPASYPPPPPQQQSAPQYYAHDSSNATEGSYSTASQNYGYDSDSVTQNSYSTHESPPAPPIQGPNEPDLTAPEPPKTPE